MKSPGPPTLAVSVADAASHLGISTLRVRHRLRTGTLKGFCDNRGHWQVYLDTAPTSEPERPLDGSALTDMLVEELLEANDRIAEQDAAIKRLHGIVDRQQQTLDRIIGRLETLTASEAKPERAERVRSTLKGLVELLEVVLARYAAAKADAGRFRAMTVRAIELLEGVELGRRRNVELGDRLAAAIDVGTRAIERAELSTCHAMQLDMTLERVLALAEQNAERHRLTDQRLKRRDELLERSLAVMEAASQRLGDCGFMRRLQVALRGKMTSAPRTNDGASGQSLRRPDVST